MQIPDLQLIEVYKGNSSKYNSGTWVHPDLGLQLAQCCSPSFSIQVSKWLRELIFTGTVEIEKEKSDEEINNKYQEIIKELEEKLENAENLIQKYDNTNKEFSKFTYQSIKDLNTTSIIMNPIEMALSLSSVTYKTMQ